MMMNDLGKLVVFMWMSAMAYFMYCMWIDLHHVTELVRIYMQVLAEHIRR